MQYLLMPFRVLYKVYFLLVFALSLALLYPLFKFFLADSKRYPTAFVAMRFWAFLLHFFGGLPINVKGKSNIPVTGPYIICPNHSSFLDITCLYRIFSKYFVFTGKQEISKWPLFHIFYTSGMNILVDRASRTGAFKAFRRISGEVGRGNPVIMFPEGTVSKEAPKLTTFKSGVFVMAIQMQVPVLPVTFVNNWQLLQRKGLWKGNAGPGISEVVIHKPVQTTGLTKKNADSLQQEVRKIIEKPLKERFG